MSKQVYGALAKVFAVVLVVVGAAAVFGGNFAHGFITDQLTQEKISMPSEEGIANLPQDSQDALRPYVGQELTTGPQAKVFADNYIWEHMQSMAGGKTYEEVSGEYMAARAQDPESDETKSLYDTRMTMFMGDTLRGTLLNAYGWWTVGSVALYVGIGAIVAGVVLAVLGWGVLRTRKPATQQA